MGISIIKKRYHIWYTNCIHLYVWKYIEESLSKNILYLIYKLYSLIWEYTEKSLSSKRILYLKYKVYSLVLECLQKDIITPSIRIIYSFCQDKMINDWLLQWLMKTVFAKITSPTIFENDYRRFSLIEIIPPQLHRRNWGEC